jgi:hypothetical protein
MKRLVFLIVMVAVAFWIIARQRHEHERKRFDHPVQALKRNLHPGHGPDGRRIAAETRDQLAQTLIEAKAVLAEAHNEVQSAVGEARAEVRAAVAKARRALASRKASAAKGPLPAQSVTVECEDPELEDVEGIPVPVVSGTRITAAVPQTPVPPPGQVVVHDPKPAPRPTKALAAPAPATSQSRSIAGQISATEERAENDAFIALQHDVRDWLDPQVPRSWTPPAHLLRAMVLKTNIKTIPRDYGPMYVAELTYDSAPSRRNSLIETYNRELVQHRLTALGGTLAFFLISLAAISGYVRADEATKGYYTNRLRMLAAGGVGAAGVILYQMFG